MPSTWDYKGFKIEVDSEGQFIAKSDDDEFEATTLVRVKQIIDQSSSKALKKRAVFLPVIVLLIDNAEKTRGYNSWNGFTNLAFSAITGFSRSNRKFTGLAIPEGQSVVETLPNTKENLDLVVRYKDVRDEFHKLDRAIGRRLVGDDAPGYGGKVEPSGYNRLLTCIEEKYAKALHPKDDDDED